MLLYEGIGDEVKKCSKSKWRLQLLYPHSLSLTAQLLPTLKCHSRVDNHGTAVTSELTGQLCLCWFFCFLMLFCLFLYWFPMWQHLNVSLWENWSCLCHSLHSILARPSGMLSHKWCCVQAAAPVPRTGPGVCAAAGLPVTGSNPISLPELSAAGVDSENSASPDSSCCCLVLKHKWLIANLAPRQEQSAEVLFIEVFICATSLSILLSVREGS